MTGRRFLIISGHDYRSKRKASIHFITSSLRRYGKVNFYSIGFSLLSYLKKDHRSDLWFHCNRVSEFEDVSCYLERNLIHPFNTNREWLKLPEDLLFEGYKVRPRRQLHDWAQSADTIIFESGIPVLLARQIARANPNATKIYVASDDLRTIGCSNYLIQALRNSGESISYASLPSRLLARAMPQDMQLFMVPHGFDQAIFAADQPSPYLPGTNAVSVGSMLFDANFFEIACRSFPEVTFFIIGGGRASLQVTADNAVVLPEMAFPETVRYIKHASIGIAPYAAENVPYYLSDTSMKLIQFQAAGINAVCPHFAVGNKPGRIGYEPRRVESIVRAIREALTTPRIGPIPFLNWDEIADRTLFPRDFSDTLIDP